MRIIDHEKTSRKISAWRSPLPLYFSKEFGRRYCFKEDDMTEEATKGHGPGGQATNVRRQSCVLRHTPTGLIVRQTQSPSLIRNRGRARQLMHLRLEHRLAGRFSRMGMMEERRKRRSSAEIAKNEALRHRGEICHRLRSKRHLFCDFLVGERHMPCDLAPMCPITRDIIKTPLFPDKFFNDWAGHWWILLETSFHQPQHDFRTQVLFLSHPVPLWFCYFFPVISTSIHSPPVVGEVVHTEKGDAATINLIVTRGDQKAMTPSGVAPPSSSIPEDVAAVATHTAIPEDVAAVVTHRAIPEDVAAVATHVAAVATHRAKEVERQRIERRFHRDQEKKRNKEANLRFHLEQMSKCSTSKIAQANIVRALRCFLEAFGLYLRETVVAAVPTSTSQRLLKIEIVRDGASWLEHCGRIVEDHGGATTLTPIAKVLFPHVYVSLVQCQMKDEALALRRFVFLEGKGLQQGNKDTAWASMLLQEMKCQLESA